MPGTYRVMMQATSLYGCVDTTGVDVYVSNELAIYAPTAFTPNHDELNETFKVIVDGIDPSTYNLMVYNRWGEIIFSSESYEEEWNGRFNEEECAGGVYVWVLKFTDNYGNEHTETGNVTLLR
jgi:gliding motility-associated-like protein